METAKKMNIAGWIISICLVVVTVCMLLLASAMSQSSKKPEESQPSTAQQETVKEPVFSQDDIEKVGENVGRVSGDVRDMVGSVDWQGVKETTKDYGSSFAEGVRKGWKK